MRGKRVVEGGERDGEWKMEMGRSGEKENRLRMGKRGKGEDKGKKRRNLCEV